MRRDLSHHPIHAPLVTDGQAQPCRPRGGRAGLELVWPHSPGRRVGTPPFLPQGLRRKPRTRELGVLRALEDPLGEEAECSPIPDIHLLSRCFMSRTEAHSYSGASLHAECDAHRSLGAGVAREAHAIRPWPPRVLQQPRRVSLPPHPLESVLHRCPWHPWHHRCATMSPPGWLDIRPAPREGCRLGPCTMTGRVH